MTIHLRPELEELIRQDVQRGPYRTIDEFVEQAVVLLHDHEGWLASHRDEIAARIDEGWKAAGRGELTAIEEVQARMAEKKRDWVKSHRPA